MTWNINILISSLIIIFIHRVHGVCEDSFRPSTCAAYKDMGICETYGKLCERTCGTCSDAEPAAEVPCSLKDTIRLECSQKCTLISGIPTCDCYPGFRANGSNCDDVNECQMGSHDCDNYGMQCHNYVGGSYCGATHKCNAGESKYYRKNGCCKFDNGEKCGRPYQANIGRVYGGVDAMRKQWPWMVHINYKPYGERRKQCGGSLIAKNWVITAAHCLQPVKAIYRSCRDCLKLHMGVHDFSLPFEPARIALGVKRIVIHDGFDMSGLQNDIALIEVDDVDLNVSEYVKHICLPSGETPADDTKCFIAGWGKTEHAESSDILQETGASIRNAHQCKDTYDSLNTASKVRTTDHICAEGESYDGNRPADACKGDSGGPLMCQRCENCNWYVAGIVSFGDGCAQSQGVYTSTTLYEKWIREIIEAPKVTAINEKGLSCKSCCKYIKMTGHDLQTSRQGYYELQRDMFGKRKVYKQMYKTDETNYIWFLHDIYNVWYVSNEIGNKNNGGFLSPDATNCPDKAPNWRVYDERTRKWPSAGNGFKVDCVEAPTPMWSDWSDWSDCSQECRRDTSSTMGKQERSRLCSTGTGCRGSNKEVKDCGRFICYWNEWSEWDIPVECQICNVNTNHQTRSRTCNDGGDCAGDATETAKCDNSCPEWGDWSECSPKTCGRIRQRECYPNCRGSDMEEFEHCDDQPCDGCCPIIIADIPDDIKSQEPFRLTYRMLQTTNNDRPVYQGFQDGIPKDKYLTFSHYDLWIFSNTVSGTGAGIYRMGDENCPIQTDGWSYVDDGSWNSDHQITLKCADISGNVIKQTPPTKASNTTTTTTTIATTTILTTHPTVLSSWTQWTTDCGRIICGEGRNTRSRPCQNQDDCGQQTEQVEYKVCHKQECRTDCCNQVRVTVTDDVHEIRSGMYLQRANAVGSRPVYEFTGLEKVDYLYFAEDYNAWVINKNLNDTEAFLYSRTNVTCIDQAFSDWHSFSSSGWIPASVTIECVKLEEPIGEEKQTNDTVTVSVVLWTEWSSCSASCDGYQQRHIHEITSTEQRGCGGPCPYTTSWSEWTVCSTTCGSGMRQRTRECKLNNSLADGCAGSLSENGSCNTDPCVTLSCCKHITMSSSHDILAPRMGSYEAMNETVNNRVLYKHTSATSYLLSVSQRYWLLADDYVLRNGKIYHVAYGNGDDECPTESSDWHVFEHNTWKGASDIEIKCGTEWSMWSSCDKSCEGGRSIRDRFGEDNQQVRETKDCKYVIYIQV